MLKRLLFSFFIFHLAYSFAQPSDQSTSFKYNEIKEVLADAWVSTIMQDADGFIWAGTQDGLYKYNGKNFKIYRYNPKNANSLPGNWVRAIEQDRDGIFWIGVYGAGLVKFDERNATFENVEIKTKNSNLNARLVYDIFISSSAALWVTTENGLYRKSQSDSIFTHLKNPSSSVKFLELENGTELTICNDTLFKYNNTHENLEIVLSGVVFNDVESIGNNEIIYSADSKLYYYNFNSDPKEIKLPNQDIVYAISSIKNRKCIILADKTNYILNTANKSFETYHYDLKKFKDRGINRLFIDKQNLLWISTNKGLFKENSLNNIFTNQIEVHARRIYVDSTHLYFGGGKGFFIVGKENIASLELILDTPKITALCKTKEGFWLSDYSGNVFFIDKAKKIKNISFGNFKIGTQNVFGIVEDSNGLIWICTWNGLFVFNSKGNLLNTYKLHNSKEIKILEIIIDTHDNLWAITVGEGLYKIPDISKIDTSKNQLKYQKYTHDEEDLHSLNSDILMDIHMSQNGIVWVGSDFGLNMYNPEKDNFSPLTINGQIFDKKIMAIETDANSLLWISTIKNGLYVYNQEDATLFNLTKEDGLISNACLYSSSFIFKDELYFGTDEGVQVINPSKFTYPSVGMAPVFSEMAIQGEFSETFQNITSVEIPIKLNYNQNSFKITLEIADYRFPEKVNYFYKLNESTSFWTKVEGNSINFDNLNYGDYDLLVKAAYQSSDNAPIARLELQIKPPWYKSVVAYILLFIAFAAILFYFFQLRYRQKLASTKLKAVEELDLIKSNLFTNISHELRTPLTLISGPIEHQLSKKDLKFEDREELSLVKQNADRLLNLVNQLMDIALIDSGQLELKSTKGNLNLLLKQIVDVFQYQTEKKNLQIHAHINNLESVWFDRDSLEKIVFNLLSNAVKYATPNSKIEFDANQQDNALVLSVVNSSNKTNKDLAQLFQRFYQDDISAEGVGVGLALVKELVMLNKGTILVTKLEANKIQFTVTLPITEDAINTSEIKISTTQLVNNENNSGSILSDDTVILMVEDDDDIRKFVTSVFKNHYKIIEAVNGEVGVELAMKHIPDLIISDVMMPIMDGIALCDSLKNNELTSHIPIILLTAKVGEEHEIAGLKTGADAYITKPFSLKKLKTRVKKLLEGRAQLQKHYSKDFSISTDIKITSTEIKFLKRLQEILKTHLTNSNFTSEYFAEVMLMSRTQLHRKLKAIVNMTTSEFIRKERLKLAIQLLKDSDATVAEIAYRVGFNSPSYFIKCFRDIYNCTPIDYLKK